MLRANRFWRQLALLLLVTVSTARSFIVLAPSVFLAGNEETILVINPFPRTLKGRLVLTNNPQIGMDNPYQPQDIQLAPNEFRVVKFQIDQAFTPHIDLHVTFDGKSQLRTFQVSQKSLHLTVQTDKPIYTPKEKKVNVRLIAVNQEIRPANQTYRVQIKNPDKRVVMSRDFHNSTRSMFDLEYEFPEDPDLGEWSVVVHYGSDLRQTQEQSFELKEYILPTFRVTIDVADTLVPTMTSTVVKIKATHVYGKPVQGQVLLKEFISTAAGSPVHYGSVNWTRLDDEGEARITIDLTKYAASNSVWRTIVLEKRLLLEAEVYEHTSGKTVTVTSDRAIFEKSLYKVSIKEMQKSIRPGFPVLVTIRVRHANGAVAQDVIVEIKAFNDDEQRITGAFSKIKRTDMYGLVSFNVPTEASYTQVRLEFDVGDYGKASKSGYTLLAHIEKEFIALEKVPLETQFSVGQTLPVDLNFRPPDAFTGGVVAIVNAGRIVQVKQITKEGSSGTAQFSVTAEMSPTARVVAVGYKPDGRVSMDSFKIMVKPHCHEADYKIDLDIFPNPGGPGALTVRGAKKGTIVGISVVDQAVYALKDRAPLTNRRIADKFREADRGCSDGGGVDLEESAAATGFVLITDRLITKNCQDNQEKRRHRRSALLETRSNDPFAMKCCELSLTNYHSGRTCEERSDSLIHVFDGKLGQQLRELCQRHFLQCCPKTVAGFVRQPTYGLPEERPMIFLNRGRDKDYDMTGIIDDDDPIPEKHVRKDFRESFLFREVEIEEDESEPKISFTLPHSITTWSLETVSVNPRGGVCSVGPTNIEVVKDFFIQLDMPYKVVRNEHVQIKATLFNYKDYEITGRLYLYGVHGVCTEAAAGQKSEYKLFRIQPYSAYKIAYPVFPTHNGSHPIKLEAKTYDGAEDAVVKNLYVVPEGREVRRSYSVALDPTNSQRRKARSITCGPSCRSQIDPGRKNQTIVIDTTLPDDVVDGTGHATLRVIGEKMGPAVVTALDDIESMLTLPKGCGEQNMMRLAPLVFVTEFRKAIEQLDDRTEQRAKDHIMMAYNRQITFRKPDGSFSAFRNRRSSVWLTAFVAKVFCRATPLFSDPSTFQSASADAVDWLLTKQKSDGAFEETKPILHKSLLGGIRGQKALTAFVTLTLDECQNNVKPNSERKWRTARDTAKSYLMKRLDETQEGYTAALMAYALSNTNMSSRAMTNLRDHLVLNQDSNTLTISSKDNAPATIEGNGYALLASTRTKRNDIALPLSNWLVTEQGATGGFQSTQDTVVALQALSEYFSKHRSSAIDLSLLVSHGKNFKRDLRVAEDSAMTLQTMTTDDLGDKMYVHATGSGTGLLSVLIKYNTIIPPAERCIFNVTISAKAEEAGDVDSEPYIMGQPSLELEKSRAIKTLNDLLQKHEKIRSRRSIRADQLVYRLEVCAFVLGDSPTGMSVIQVDMITGYSPIRGDLATLQQLSRIERFEMLPDRVNLYVSEFLPGKKVCFDFRVVQEFTVSNAQPAAVSAYDYYTKGGNCPTFYELRSFKKVLVECGDHSAGSRQDRMCSCIQNTCPPRPAFAGSAKFRIMTVNPGRQIAKEHICRNDLMFVGTVVDCETLHRTVFCRVEVNDQLQVKGVQVGDIVTFVVHEHCKRVMVTREKHMFLAKVNLPHSTDGVVVHRNHTLSSSSIILRLAGPDEANIVANFDYVAKNMPCP